MFGGAYTSPDCVGDVAASAFDILASICDQYRHIWILIQNLLYSTVIATLLWFNAAALSAVIVVIHIAQVVRL